MPETLFPVIDVPAIVTPTAVKEQKYKSSVSFDYELGDFTRDGAGKMLQADGREAYMQWCMKTVMTERFTCLSYNADIGTEMIDALVQADHAAVESAIERTINEAIMVNPKTEYVRDYEFIWNNAELLCNFTVKGRNDTEQRIGISLNV